LVSGAPGGPSIIITGGGRWMSGRDKGKVYGRQEDGCRKFDEVMLNRVYNGSKVLVTGSTNIYIHGNLKRDKIKTITITK
jgi:hypothetical protein